MSDAVELGAGRRVRRWRSISEKLEIVQLTLKPGASVAEVARAHGVNANQVFKWRRAFERGELSESSVALIPVTVESRGDDRETEEVQMQARGSIHIELPGRAVISVESGADLSLVRSILESLRKWFSFLSGPRSGLQQGW
jgi:transposase